MVRGFSVTCDHQFIAKASVDACREDSQSSLPKLIILSRTGRHNFSKTRKLLKKIEEWADQIPVVILSDSEDAQEILDYLQLGAKGCIPTSLPLDVAVEAINLVLAGGVFIPANSLLSAPETEPAQEGRGSAYNGVFTTRQSAVIDGLCRGKQNKTIAYELNVSESTIKVHVRNIMKKLKARNRTEVAFLINEHYTNI